MAVYKKAVGEQHFDYAKTLIEAGNMLAQTSKLAEAEKYILLGSQLMLNYIQKNFLNLSEAEKMKWWTTNSSYFECIPSFLLIHKDASATFLQQACSIQMQQKSVVLLDGIKTMLIARKKGNPELLVLLEQWQMNKAMLAKQYSIPAIDRMNNLDSLEVLTNEQEKNVNNQSSSIMGLAKSQQIGFKDIQKKLKPNEAAIEFLQFELNRKDWTDSTFYAAFIMLPNDTVPHFVTLCEEQQLARLLDSKNNTQEGFVKQLYRSTIGGTGSQASINKGDSLYELIIKPLQPFLNRITTLYIAPVGLLNRVSFDALPIAKNILAIEKYTIRQYNGINQLAEEKHTSAINSTATFYGGINYQISSPEKTKFGKTILTLPDAVKRNMGGNGFTYLPGTLEEVNSIQALFASNQKSTQLLIDTFATEESFKSLSGHSPTIIHVSTHGFSLPNAKHINADENQFTLADNPLLRTGIVMAGANKVWTGNSSIQQKEDGILTAYEISNLDLSNTELVVLSACETALGDIKGTEGVFGLQRAFKLAGAKNMIMSLWQVPDKETVELMTIFYSHKLNGMSIYESFNKAKNAMRKKYAPYYWAAFVLIE
ncbi:MAG: CHAT domain-containing protein [Chitinophagaceae bacterium]|nr:CHAT domain-containing protein [Chitinophagaceae bacterium]